MTALYLVGVPLLVKVLLLALSIPAFVLVAWSTKRLFAAPRVRRMAIAASVATVAAFWIVPNLYYYCGWCEGNWWCPCF